MLAFDDTEIIDQLSPALRQTRAATALAAGQALDQRFASQVIHGVDRVPGRLVAHLDGLGRMRDGAMFGDGARQFHPARTAQVLAAYRHPYRALQADFRCLVFYIRHQAALFSALSIWPSRR